MGVDSDLELMSVDSDLDHLADEVSVDSLHFSHFPTMVI
jgi:hypothetical protein